MRKHRVAVAVAFAALSACTGPDDGAGRDGVASSSLPAPDRTVGGPGLIPTRLAGDVTRPSPRNMIPSDARLLDVQRVALSRRPPREVVVVWERTLGHNEFDFSIMDNAMAVWHRSRSGWRLAFQIHETPLEETVVGECVGTGCYESSDGRRVYTLTSAVIVGPGPQAVVEESMAGSPQGRFMRPVVADVIPGGGRELFVVQNSSGSGGYSTYRVLTWTSGAVYQRFRKVHGDGCIVPARGRLILRGSVYRRGDSHCCPSFHRYAQLEYVAERYRYETVRSEVRRVRRTARSDAPGWAAPARTCYD